MEYNLFNQEGKQIGKIDLSDKVFSLPFNSDFLHQTILYYQSLSRKPIAKAKDRGEVRGGGKKPWRQKGTGRARHGSIRSPLWRGGGVTFGPTLEKQYQRKISREAKRKSLFMVLSQKLREGEIIFIDKIDVPEQKTKKIIEILKNFNRIKKDIKEKRTIFVLAQRNEKFLKAARNIKNISSAGINSLNPYILLKHKYLVIEKSALKKINQ